MHQHVALSFHKHPTLESASYELFTTASAPKHPLRHTLRKKVEIFPSLKIPSGKQFIPMVHYFGEKWKRVLQGFTLVFKLRADQVGCSNVAGRKPALITRVP